MNSALLAFIVSLVCTVVLVVQGCHRGYSDSCGMTQGMAPFLLAILFLVSWAIIGSIKAAFSFLVVGKPEGTSDAEPPVLLEGARVLVYAATDDGVTRLAICENLAGEDVFLLRCDASWNVLAAGRFASLEDAKKSAESSYKGKWHSYRALSEAEKSHVEATRSRLRDMTIKGPE